MNSVLCLQHFLYTISPSKRKWKRIWLNARATINLAFWTCHKCVCMSIYNWFNIRRLLFKWRQPNSQVHWNWLLKNHWAPRGFQTETFDTDLRLDKWLGKIFMKFNAICALPCVFSLFSNSRPNFVWSILHCLYQYLFYFCVSSKISCSTCILHGIQNPLLKPAINPIQIKRNFAEYLVFD